VEFVFERPTLAIPATKKEYLMIVRKTEKDSAVVTEFVLKGGKYRIRSAFVLTDGQLDKKIEKSRQEPGSHFPKFFVVPT
jgi:hypothetical protein